MDNTATAMLIYEVTVSLPAKELTRMVEYMRSRHIHEVLEHEAFSSATLFVQRQDASASTDSFTVHYAVTSREQFDEYQAGYAISMREDFSRELGSVHATVTRRVLGAGELFRPKQ